LQTQLSRCELQQHYALDMWPYLEQASRYTSI